MKNALIVIPGDREILSPLQRLVQTLLDEILFVPASVIGASSETQAMELIRHHPIDLLLVEHTAPRINGIHFVRSIPNRSSIRRVILIAKAPLTPCEMEQMVQERIDLALERPLIREGLKQILREVLLKAEPI